MCIDVWCPLKLQKHLALKQDGCDTEQQQNASKPHNNGTHTTRTRTDPKPSGIAGGTIRYYRRVWGACGFPKCALLFLAWHVVCGFLHLLISFFPKCGVYSFWMCMYSILYYLMFAPATRDTPSRFRLVSQDVGRACSHTLVLVFFHGVECALLLGLSTAHHGCFVFWTREKM